MLGPRSIAFRSVVSTVTCSAFRSSALKRASGAICNNVIIRGDRHLQFHRFTRIVKGKPKIANQDFTLELRQFDTQYSRMYDCMPA